MGATQVETGGVKDNSITSSKILDSEIETSDIKDGAVTTSKLANGAEDGKVLTSNNGSAPTFNTPTVEGTDVKSTTNGNETDTKFLRADGSGGTSWAIPVGAVLNTSQDGLAPQLPNPHGGKFLKADGSWTVPYTTVNNSTNPGLVPALPSSDPNIKFLRGSGTWEELNYTVSSTTTGNAGTDASVSLSDTAFSFTIPRGDTGATGPDGAQGPQGTQGIQGIQGIQGNTGDTGATGATGATGSQGPAGQDGVTQDISGKADLSGAAFTGNISTTGGLTTGATISNFGGNISINTVFPQITFNDTNNDSDFKIINANGTFKVNDSTNSVDRFTIASDGVVDVAGNLDVGAGLDVTGDITATGSVDAGNQVSVTGGTPRITLAVFGSSADLEIYHSGNESWIKDSGTGNLYIASSGLHVVNAGNTKNAIRTIDDGAVQLFYNGTQYLATYDGGVNIFGLLSAVMTPKSHAGDLSVRANTHSGFYQHSTASDGVTAQNDGVVYADEYWPDGAKSWWHLTANTHENTANYYSQQFASSFFSAYDIYHRNTNHNGTTGATRDWQKLYGSRCDAIPAVNDTYDLGSDLLRWQDIYVAGNINVSGTVDGVDVAKLDALAYCNLNKTSVTEDINVDGDTEAKVPIKWDNTVYKSATYTHSTDTSTTDTRQKVTVTSAGLYMINVTLGHDNNNNTRIGPNISIYKNGTEITETRASSYGRGQDYGDQKAMQINTVLQLSANDYLEVYAWCPYAQHSQAVNTIVGECEFVMTRLAGGVEAE